MTRAWPCMQAGIGGVFFHFFSTGDVIESRWLRPTARAPTQGGGVGSVQGQLENGRRGQVRIVSRPSRVRGECPCHSNLAPPGCFAAQAAAVQRGGRPGRGDLLAGFPRKDRLWADRILSLVDSSSAFFWKSGEDNHISRALGSVFCVLPPLAKTRLCLDTITPAHL